MPAFVKKVKAQKDYPQFGIKRGQEHYTWSIPSGGGFQKFRSITKPRDSQLVPPGYQQDFAVLRELAQGMTEIEDVTEIAELIERVTELKDETEEKLSNMPEQLQDSDTGQLMKDRIAELETWIDELNDILSDAENISDSDTDVLDEWADINQRVQSVTP